MRATDALRRDHEAVHRLFQEFEQAPAGPRRQALLDEIAEELEIHAKVEEEIFYPALRGASSRIADAESAHQHVTRLLGEVEGGDPASEEFARGVRRLTQAVLSHVAEEEGAIFLEAGRLGAERLEQLGGQIEEHKETLRTSAVQRGVRSVKQAARKIA